MKLLFIILLMLFWVKGQTQPIYKNSITNTGTGSPATVTLPAGVISGDLLVIGFMFEKGLSETITHPAGWSLISRSNNGSDIGMATYYKIAGENESASYSFSFNNGSKWSLGISRISGSETSGAIEGFSTGSGNSGNVSAPSITTLGSNRLILCFYTNKKSATYSPPSSTTERYDAPNTSGGLPSNLMASFIQSIAGSTGNKQANPSESEKWVAQQIAVVPSSVLPINLINFNAGVCNNSTVCLNWETVSEARNDYFTIERSMNRVDWESVGKINGSGNSSTTQFYKYTDKDPYSGVSYYRLKQTDFNGQFSFSAIKKINLKERIELSIYPTPAREHVIVKGNEDEISEIQIFNSFGQNITPRLTIIKINDNEVKVHISNLLSGLYYLKTKNSLGKIHKQ